MQKKAVPDVVSDLKSDRSLKVFPTRDAFADDAVIWAGKEANEFLDYARQASVDTIYVREVTLEKEDVEDKPELSERVGQPILVELGFYRNGLWHVFEWSADWADQVLEADADEEEEDEADAGEPPKKSDWERLGKELGERQPELVTAYIESLGGADEIPTPDSDWELRPAFLRFLSEKLELPRIAPPQGRLVFLAEGHSDREIPRDVEKTLKAALKEVGIRIRARDRSIVDGLVPKCAAWVTEREIGLRTFSLARVSEFLNETDSRISRAGRSDLWSRTIAMIKRSRPGGSHHH